MKKKLYTLAVLILLVSVHAWAQNMQRLPNGAQYRIISSANKAKIKLNDVITFNFIQKTDKDSVLMSSYASGQPAKIQVMPSKNIGDLMDIFPLLAEKDSAIVTIPSDSIFKDYEQGRPSFLSKGSSLLFTLKIERVQSLDSAIAENNRMMEALKMQEKASLAQYIAHNELKLKTTPSGLMYLITKPSVKPKPQLGDTVYVNYTGRTIDGKVFDSSIEAVAKQAGLEQPGRVYEPIKLAVGQGEVIKGWDEGLLLFNEGAKGLLVIQSDLAYGPQGAGDAIKPFSSLLFDIELVKVKHGKKSLPATAKKPAATVKKPGTAIKKPAAKPAPKPAVKKAPAKK